MVENYLQILIESLEKKQNVLEHMSELNERQTAFFLQDTIDKEAFDHTMDEKQMLIDELNALDAGFEKTYELVREDVLKDKTPYLTQLKKLQELVNTVVEKGVSIQAQEIRLKNKLDVMFKREYKSLRDKRLSMKISQGYYQNANQINYIDPQLMDRKK